MIPTLCHIYAYTVARTWAGLGIYMYSHDNLITNGTTILAVAPGCLSLRAILITTLAGTLIALTTRRWHLALIGAALGILTSWLRVFVLVPLAFTRPALFDVLHARCGFASVACSLSLLFIIVLTTTTHRRYTP